MTQSGTMECMNIFMRDRILRNCRSVVLLGVLAILSSGCIIRQTVREPKAPRQAEFEKLQKRRDKARSNRTLSGIGLAAGIVMSAVGIALLAHASDVRGRESSADDEDGIGALLGGMLLTGTGVAASVGSGIGLGVYSHRLNKVEQEIELYWHANPEHPAVGLRLRF